MKMASAVNAESHTRGKQSKGSVLDFALRIWGPVY